MQDVCGAVQLPQETVPPQPSEAAPQVLLPQAWAAVIGVQTHVFVAVQVCGAVQLPQFTAAQPLPGLKDPQTSPVGQVVGQTTAHVPLALQVWGAVQVPH